MPISVTNTAGGDVTPTPFLGPINHPATVVLDVSTLGTSEVDQYGYVRAGLIVQQNGDKITAPAQIAYGAIVESTKVAADNVAATLAAAPDVTVVVALFCLLNRSILEDSLGRVLSADELASVDIAGSHVALTSV